MTLPSPAAPPSTQPARFRRWQHRVLAFCLIVFAFELGLFLLVFPWLKVWERSWVPVHSQYFAKLWMSQYFRGAISGLGLLNIYIALVEAVKQLKLLFSPPAA